jgi:hypothetical protein
MLLDLDRIILDCEGVINITSRYMKWPRHYCKQKKRAKGPFFLH